MSSTGTGGRRVTVHTAGAAGAPTVLLQHGMPGTGVDVAPPALGVRLIGHWREMLEALVPGGVAG